MTRPTRIHRHQCAGVDCTNDAMGYPMCWLPKDIDKYIAERKRDANLRIGGIPQEVVFNEHSTELPDGMTVRDTNYRTYRRHGPFWYRAKGKGKPLTWLELIKTRGPIRGRILVPVRPQEEAA